MSIAAKVREVTYIKAKEETLPKLRVAAYVRVSTNSEDQLNSFSAQIRHYTAYVNSKENWELVDIYADEGTTGVAKDKREEFNRMIADCKQGKIDKVITKSASRFARNTEDSLSVVRELNSIGVGVYFEKEGIDTGNMTDELLLTLHSLFAQEESKAISLNCKKGIRMRMKQGKYVPSKAPFGYRLTGKQFEIDEKEAKIVRRIFSEYLSGKGIVEIAKGLEKDRAAEEIGSRRWQGNTVLRILVNEKYIGDMLHQKNYNEDTLPYKERKNQGELAKYYVKDTHDAIIERADFEKVQALLKKRKEKEQERDNGESVFSKMIICGNCGRKYRKQVSRDITYYSCRAKSEAKESCSSKRIREDMLKDSFVRMNNKLKSDEGRIIKMARKLYLRVLIRQEEKNEELRKVNKELSDIREEIHTLTKLLETGVLDSALFISSKDVLITKEKSINQKRKALISSKANNEILSETDTLIEIIESEEGFLDSFDEELFMQMVKKIRIIEDKAEFILLGDFRFIEQIY